MQVAIALCDQAAVFRRRGTLHKAQFEPCLIGHHIHAPRRLPNQLNIHMFDAGQGFNGLGHPAGHFTGDRAAGRGEGHGNFHLGVLIDVHRINEAKIENINGNFRILHRADAVDNIVIQRVICARGRDQWCTFNRGLVRHVMILEYFYKV